MKHTKGKWEIMIHDWFDENHPIIAVRQPDSDKVELVCKTMSIRGQSFKDNSQSIEANLKLIASAPELLEALQSITKFIDTTDSSKRVVLRVPQDEMLKCIKAINKATL